MKRHLHRPTVTTRYYQFHLQTPTNTSKYQQVHLKTSTYKQSYLQGYKKSSPKAISSHQMPTKSPQNDTKVTYKSHQIHLQKPTVTSRNQTIRHFKTKLKSSPNITKATSTYKQIYLQRYKSQHQKESILIRCQTSHLKMTPMSPIKSILHANGSSTEITLRDYQRG